MFPDQILAVINHPHEPTFFFCVGLFVAVLFCALTLMIDSSWRQRVVNFVGSTSRAGSYQQFRTQLASSARHIDFTPVEIHELHERDFLSE